jgi:hypothetical protein
MGTSSSSKGSPSNVPMVPPWVPDVPSGPPDNTPPDAAPDDGIPPTPTPGDNLDLAGVGEGDGNPAPTPVPTDDKARLAPAGRFGAARTNLTSFARNSDRQAMRRGIRHYVSQGYGGNGAATRRMGGTIRSSEALLSAVSGGAANPFQALGAPLDPALLAGRSADDIMDAVTDAVRPVDGTQDSESSRAAIRDALSDTLEKYPAADLLNLTDQQKEHAIEAFVAGDLYGRFYLDLGTHVIENAPSTSAGLSRLKEVRDYIRETVAEAFRNLKAKGESLSKSRVATVVRDAIRETFAVFEAYTR